MRLVGRVRIDGEPPTRRVAPLARRAAAPKDGSPILVSLAKANSSGISETGIAYWTDHNGGGWVAWHSNALAAIAATPAARRVADTMTKAQRRVLEWLRDHRDGATGYIICEGLECWYGLRRTNRVTVDGLLVLCLVSQLSNEGGCELYAINESGVRALQGLPPYRDSEGNWHETTAFMYGSPTPNEGDAP